MCDSVADGNASAISFISERALVIHDPEESRGSPLSKGLNLILKCSVMVT